MGYIGGRPDGLLSEEKYYTLAEVRERERAAAVKAYYAGWITGCVSPAMTQAQIIEAAEREYPKEA
ncbi:MAG: hypothetical protein PHO67_08205 [Candidatus Omnitrophica bacterium]|nr:hypothetical protein [Candidatus Omnitrophota bacterium]